MKSNNLMSAVDFTREYLKDKSRALIYVQKKKGHKHIHRIGNHIYVDVDALLKRRNFKDKIQLIAQQNYFELAENNSNAAIAKMISDEIGSNVKTWETFISESLFKIDWIERPILEYKVTMRMWKFYRATTWILRRRKK